MIVIIIIKKPNEEPDIISRHRTATTLLAHWKHLKSKYSNKGYHFFLVNATRPTPPQIIERRDNPYYCPYCRDDRLFYLDEGLGVDKCEVCGISTRDFYVRKYNEIGV